MSSNTENCSRETAHRVPIEIRTENERATTSAFSREPYRVSTRVACGERTVGGRTTLSGDDRRRD
ncbi:DUF7835 family putative zinc beta-ribbon protein [Haladaptatus salinisoli]|uniref:DUF7835 family putative zinc beta-ribbon protein n=1 Tax=Haladaptatus salinisoli TaxID=2884876 RepID=UPI001D0A05ED|nr:hypothetical protein [Haladaptatus salinisoli]